MPGSINNGSGSAGAIISGQAAGGDLAGTYPNPTVKTAASLPSPVLTGTPTTPDQPAKDNSGKVANTKYVDTSFPSGNGAPNTQTANYTLVLADAGKTVEMNSASALTATVPPNSAVAFPIGTITEVVRHGAGTVAIAAGAGVTIRSRGGLLSIGNQYGAVSLRKRATDEWVLVGDLA